MAAERLLVVDTNLWVSRLLMPRGIAAQAVDHALASGIALMSDPTMDELHQVLFRPKFDRYVSRQDREQFLRLLGAIARWTPITRTVCVCRDPKDDKFLDVAVNGQAGLILTGDQDLLVMHPFEGIEILGPAQFLAR